MEYEYAQGGWLLLAPAPHLCQACAVAHAADQPHNRDSLYYQMAFRAEHGRWPTWDDAMAHCPEHIKAAARCALDELGVV